MAYTTINMGLNAWDLETDPYDHNDLLQNWLAIDAHDHTPGKGRRLTGASLEANTLTHRELGFCSVGEDELCDDTVSVFKLKNNAVTEPKLATDAVTNPKIADSAVDTDELADGAVTNPKIADSAVGESKLNTASVSSVKIKTAAVTEGKIGTHAVTTPKLNDGAVTNPKLGTNSVTQVKVADRTIGAAEHGYVPAGFVHRTSSISINSNELTFIPWNASRYDNDSMWAGAPSPRLWCRTSGIYAISGGIRWQGTNEGANQALLQGGRIARLWKNEHVIASDGPKTSELTDGGPYATRHSMGQVIDLRAGDYLRIEVGHRADGPLRVWHQNFVTHLAMTWIAPIPGA